MARVALTLLWLACWTAGCWRDPDAVAARFAVASPDTSDGVTLADVPTTTCPEGDDCSADAPCLYQPTCHLGVCTGPDRLWWQTKSLSSERDELTAVVALDDGGVFSVGSARVSTPPYGLARHLFAFHARADGMAVDGTPLQPLWLKQDAAHDHRLNGLIWLGSGKFLGVGQHAEVDGPLAQQPKSWAWWMQIDLTGGAEFDGKLEVTGSHAWNAIAQASDGASVAVGVLNDSGLVTRFLANGDKGWSRVLLPVDGTRARLDDVAALPGSGEAWVAAGYTVNGGGDASGGWAVGLAGPGTAVSWNETYAPPPGLQGAFYHVTVGPAGVLALGAVWPDADAKRGGEWPHAENVQNWLVRIDPKTGTKLDERTWTLAGPITAVANTTTERIAVWHSPGSGTLHGVLAFLDPWGNVTAQSDSPWNQVIALAPSLDGGLFAAGVAQSAAGDTLLGRLDPWGASSCSQSGACFSKDLSGCDDGLPCTADRCDPTAGCQHTPLPDSSPCGPGTCHAGACTP